MEAYRKMTNIKEKTMEIKKGEEKEEIQKEKGQPINPTSPLPT
jgi:hypothetical protein